MALNYLFIAFFVIAFLFGVVRALFFGEVGIFQDMMKETMSMAKTGFEISLGLTGVLTLWLGILKIGEKGGVIKVFSRGLEPLFRRLFPGIPKGHPAYGSVMMNVAANMLGLDNAATPIGLRAMGQMQELNKEKETASNAMIMFLVLNTSGLTLIPISVMVYRAQMGAANPADIFIPIMLSTYFSTLAGLIAVGIVQKLKLWDKVVLAYLGGITAIIVSIIVYFSTISQDKIQTISSAASNIILFGIIITFILVAVKNRVNIYEAFIEGAKDGFPTAIKIIPYLIAILVAIGVFRASGAMDMLIDGLEWFFATLGVNTDFVEALPTAFMQPLSGSGARGMMVDAMETHGADSFVGRVASTVQGATDTTFYIIAVYFGSVGIRNTRHAVQCGLIADFAGIIASILIAYLFFH
ncbi:MAG: spore maturation protein [Bacteroidales bacterium]|nr:spore maturation protein [Bacteroidales bacterium]